MRGQRVALSHKHVASPNHKLTKRNRRNVKWNAFGGVSSILGSLLLFPIGIAGMGPATYGLWLLCFTTTTLLTQADLGLGTAVVREIARASDRGNRLVEESIVRVCFIIFLGLAVLLAGAQYLGLTLYFNYMLSGESGQIVSSFILMSSVALFLTVLGRYYNALLQAYERYDLERKFAVVGLVVRAIIVTIAWQNGMDPWIVALGETLGLIIPAIATFYFALHHKILKLSLPRMLDFKMHARRILKFSLPVFISTFSSMAAIQVPIYIVGAVLTPTAAAQYAAATKVYTTARTVYSWLTGPSFPVAAKLHARNEYTEIRKLHYRLLLQCLSLGGLIGSLIFFLPSTILEVWLGPEMASGATAMSVFGIALLLFSAYSPGVVLSSALGRPGIIAKGNLAWLVLTVSTCYPAAHYGGLVGAATAAVAPLVLLSPFFLSLPLKQTGLRYKTFIFQGLLLVAMPAAAAASLSGVAWLDPLPEVVHLLFVGAVALCSTGLTAMGIIKISSLLKKEK